MAKLAANTELYYPCACVGAITSGQQVYQWSFTVLSAHGLWHMIPAPCLVVLPVLHRSLLCRRAAWPSSHWSLGFGCGHVLIVFASSRAS